MPSEVGPNRWGEDPIYSRSIWCEKAEDERTAMVKTKEKNATVRQELDRRRLKRLMFRLASLEFSAPLKAAISRYQISSEYHRTE